MYYRNSPNLLSDHRHQLLVHSHEMCLDAGTAGRVKARIKDGAEEFKARTLTHREQPQIFGHPDSEGTVHLLEPGNEIENIIQLSVYHMALYSAALSTVTLQPIETIK